jgi:hypothetical protein
MVRSTVRLGAAALVSAIVFVGAVVVGAPPAAAGTKLSCRVKNVTQGTWFATSSGRALSRAIARAHAGDRLNVFGTCRGNFGIDKNLSLFGSTNRLDPTSLRGDRATDGSVLFVSSSATVTLTRLTITGGNPTTRAGGGIQNGGDLTLNNSSVVANRSALDGGGIFNFGDLTLNHSRVSGNVAGGSGGGLFNEGEAVLNFSFVTRNAAAGGGGILNVSSLTLNSTVVRGNVPDDCAC